MKTKWNKATGTYQIFYSGHWMEMELDEVFHPKKGWVKPQTQDTLWLPEKVNIMLTSPDTHACYPDFGTSELPKAVVLWLIRKAVFSATPIIKLIGKDGAIARNQAVRDCTITKVARSYVEVSYELPNAGFVKTRIEAAICGTMVHYDSRDLSF